MKLLFISNPHYADCDFPLIKELQKKGIDVTFLIMIAPHSYRSTLIDIRKPIKKNGLIKASDIPELSVYNSYMDLSKVYLVHRTSNKSYSWNFWKMNWSLYWFLKRNKFDIIHSGHMFTRFHSYVYRMCKTWIQMVHDPFPHSGESSKKKLRVYDYVFQHSDKFILLNKSQVNEFCNKYKIEKRNIFVNSLGVYDNIKSFVKVGCNPCKSKNVLFFGRISPYKGVDYLCEAFKKVHSIIPDATLTIAGGGKLYFDFTPYQNKSYIKLINHYIGIDELAYLLSETAIVVCPYTDATQSGVIMTSFGLCKPVIASNVGGLGEMIDDKETGFLVKAKDSDALADRIICLLSSNTVLKKMERNINEITLTGRFSWNVISDKYINFYKEIYYESNKENI